ncbi:hypothetical protein CRYUN_Cryun01aG0249200 [Craigia yunnanensis]
MGYLCEHVFKVIKVCREKRVYFAIFQRISVQQGFDDMLHCLPHDSLICDYAVSLAIYVQKQLNSLVSPIQKQSKDAIQQGSAPVVSANQNRGLVAEDHCVNGNILSNHENGYADCSEAPAGIASDLGSESVDLVDDINGIYEQGESALINKVTNMNCKLPPKNNALRVQNGCEEEIFNKNCNESVIAAEPQSDKIPQTRQLSKPCTATHHDGFGSKSSEPSMASMSSPEKASPSMSCTFEPQVLMTEASGALNLDIYQWHQKMRMRLEVRIILLILLSHQMAIILIWELSLILVMKQRQLTAVWLNTETFQNHSTTLHHWDSQPPIEVAAQETDDSGKKELLSNKPSATKSELQMSVEDGKCGNKEICEQVLLLWELFQKRLLITLHSGWL